MHQAALFRHRVSMEKKQIAPTKSAREESAVLLHDEIARLAYVLWEARGGGDGLAEQDWLEAERRLQESQSREPLGLHTKSQAA
jgi:Protein of unknown function (DUF2934)